ncbi:type IV secretory system conjugative DNA transfer family protein [Magnetospirillum fulvum]|uniref:TRAG protein n=1 Tax=Magnetospirillum fulvum MGU-K5 TaxID=1316936 RepID=S9TNR2_MAGFU|nr:type IV secretory system conjugative DNA transfer family protein [Magnetospirillum fulvum]EPY00230.1 TRAG protein [Magnetospirillum fulvum MGU-K5]
MRLLLLPVALLIVAFTTGLVWQVGFGFYPLEAASWIWVQDYLRAYHQLPLFLTVSLFGVAAALIILIVLLQALASRIGGRTTHGGRDDTTLHGSARWATQADVKQSGLMGKTGVVVGGWPGLTGKVRTLRHDGPEHVLAFAPTRSGKGVGLVLPTLLSWPGSVLVLDIKGENWRMTSGWRAAQGQRILKFDPTAESGGLRFNPLAEIRSSVSSGASSAGSRWAGGLVIGGSSRFRALPPEYHAEGRKTWALPTPTRGPRPLEPASIGSGSRGCAPGGDGQSP